MLILFEFEMSCETLKMVSPDMKRKNHAMESISNEQMLSESNPASPPTSLTITNAMCKPINIFTLNGDCMHKICDYCSVADLYNMSIASHKLEITILQNSIRGRTIKFSELADSCHILDVFKRFGQSMTKVEIGEKDIQYKERKYSKFDEILRLISTHCSIDTIKHLTLQYYHRTTIKKSFLYASLPFFRSIESLSIKETDQHFMEDCINYFESNCEYNAAVNNFVERIVAAAVNINSLRMHNLKISGRLFYLQHIRDLKMLSLDGCNVRAPDAFLSFLQGNPNLHSLTWNNSSLRGLDTHRSHSSNVVYELVTSSMTDLEAFHYYPNEGFINDNNKYDGEFLFKLPDYQHLAKFSKLKVLSIPGVTFSCLNVSAQQNTVEKLLTSFSQLFTSFDESAKTFNEELLCKTNHLTECYLEFFQIDEDIIELTVRSAKNLAILNISFRREENYRPNLITVRASV